MTQRRLAVRPAGPGETRAQLECRGVQGAQTGTSACEYSRNRGRARRAVGDTHTLRCPTVPGHCLAATGGARTREDQSVQGRGLRNGIPATAQSDGRSRLDPGTCQEGACSSGSRGHRRRVQWRAQHAIRDFRPAGGAGPSRLRAARSGRGRTADCAVGPIQPASLPVAFTEIHTSIGPDSQGSSFLHHGPPM